MIAFNDTVSNLTLISIGLGIFFMSAAFYKSIFHKRRPPAKSSALQPFRTDEPVSLGDPFQPQTPAESRNTNPVPQSATADPFSEFPPDSAPMVSAFRQISSAWNGAASGDGPTKTDTYEWE